MVRACRAMPCHTGRSHRMEWRICSVDRERPIYASSFMYTSSWYPHERERKIPPGFTPICFPFCRCSISSSPNGGCSGGGQEGYEYLRIWQPGREVNSRTFCFHFLLISSFPSFLIVTKTEIETLSTFPSPTPHPVFSSPPPTKPEKPTLPPRFPFPTLPRKKGKKKTPGPLHHAWREGKQQIEILFTSPLFLGKILIFGYIQASISWTRRRRARGKREGERGRWWLGGREAI